MSLRGRCLVVLVVLAGAHAGCGSDDTTTSSSSSSGGSSSGGTSGSSGAGPVDGAVPSEAGLPLDAGGDAALGPDQVGQATYYAADGTGACGFPASPANLFVAAMNATQYKKADCGRCVSVTGPKGVTVVRIVDLCPGCKNGDLDLSKQAFSAIANLSAGRVAITWHFVACP